MIFFVFSDNKGEAMLERIACMVDLCAALEIPRNNELDPLHKNPYAVLFMDRTECNDRKRL
jgi:hypothetical protein